MTKAVNTDFRVMGAVIQARMGSTRFAGKVLTQIAGRPMLAWLIDRLRLVEELDHIIVATSDLPGDDILDEFCQEYDVECYRGSEADVLGRFLDAAEAFGLDVVIRVCGDAPLTDPEGIRALIKAYREGGSRFVHSRHKLGWPVGTAADLMTTEVLADAMKHATRQDQREHVVPYLQEHPEQSAMRLVHGPTEWLTPIYHLAVDYEADLHWLKELFESGGIADPAALTLPQILSEISHNKCKPRLFEWPND